MTLEETRERMDGWARWRHHRNAGYGRSLFERLLDGMPCTKCPACRGHKRRLGSACPTCHGTGRIKLEENERSAYRVVDCKIEGCATHDSYGQKKHNENCFYCRGTGIRIIPVLNMNPAFIRATLQDVGNPVCERIDRLISELGQRDELLDYFRLAWIEWCEPCPGLTQERRAQRLRITRSVYVHRLTQIIAFVDLGLAIPTYPAHSLQFPSYRAVMARHQEVEHETG